MRNVFIICFLLSTIASIAQDSTSVPSNKSVLVGINGGPAFTNLRGEDLDKDEIRGKTHFSAGAYAGYCFNKKISLIAGIYFERKGAAWEFDDFEEEYFDDLEFSERHDFITVPVLFRYTINRKFNYYINAGPFISMALSHKSILEFEDDKYIEDSGRDYKDLDLGVSAGIGISKNLGKNWLLSLEVRNNLGLYDFYDPKGDDFIIIEDSDEMTMYTNSLSILIGGAYRFGM